MAHPDVITAVAARLASQWTATAIVEMNKEGETAAGGSDFVMLQFPVSNTRRVGVSDRAYREEGGFRLVLNTSRGLGLSDAAAKAEELAAIFRDQSFSGVNCRSPSSPFFDDSNDNGNYFTTTIVVPYDFTFRD